MTRYLTLILVAIVAVGCGGETGAVKSAIDEFAAAAEDPDRTCMLITRESRAQLERLARLSGGKTCADALRNNDSTAGDVNVEDVEVEGDRATAQETLTATKFTLLREGGEWRVDLFALDQLGWTLRQSIACSQFVTDVDKLGEPGDTPRQFIAYLRDYERLVQQWAADAEQADPPRLYAKRHRDLMSGIADFRAATRRLRAAIPKGRQASVRAYATLQRAEKAMRGFPITCGPQ